MNGRVHKLLRAFCKRYKKPYDLYLARFKELPSHQKEIVLEAMRQSLPTVH